MQTMKNDLENDFKAIDERFQMSESNTENFHERLNDHTEEYEQTISDIKELLTRGNTGINMQNSMQSVSQIQKMNQQISELQHRYERQQQIQKMANIDQYHKITMLVGGLKNFDGRHDAEECLKSKI